MDIRRLRYFLQVAEFGSLNATAEQVNLSQPSLSRQIRLLEEELGVSLFTRRRDGMVLSRDGLELRTRILGPLRQLEMALDEIKSHSSQIGGSVVLGMPSSAIDALASSLAKRAEAFPNMALHIVEGSAGQMLKSLERGEIDTALLNAPPSDTKWRCEIEDLFIEELVLGGASGSGLSPDQPVSVEELAQLPLILPSPPNHPPPIRTLVDILSGLTGGKCNFPRYADSFQLTKSYVEAGIGYSRDRLFHLSLLGGFARGRKGEAGLCPDHRPPAYPARGPWHLSRRPIPARARAGEGHGQSRSRQASRTKPLAHPVAVLIR